VNTAYSKIFIEVSITYP